MGSSRTCVPCIGRRILNHCATREVPLLLYHWIKFQNSIVWVYIIFYLSFHQLMDIWVVSTFGLLCIMLLWTIIYRFLCGRVLISLGYIPRSVFNLLRNCQTVFQSSCTILYSHQQCIRVQLHHTLLSVFLITVILVGVKWYLTVVLIPWWLMMLNIFSWLFVDLLWRNIYSDLLPIF